MLFPASNQEEMKFRSFSRGDFIPEALNSCLHLSFEASSFMLPDVPQVFRQNEGSDSQLAERPSIVRHSPVDILKQR